MMIMSHYVIVVSRSGLWMMFIHPIGLLTLRRLSGESSNYKLKKSCEFNLDIDHIGGQKTFLLKIFPIFYIIKNNNGTCFKSKEYS